MNQSQSDFATDFRTLPTSLPESALRFITQRVLVEFRQLKRFVEGLTRPSPQPRQATQAFNDNVETFRPRVSLTGNISDSITLSGYISDSVFHVLL